MNRKAFFGSVRESLFGGRLSQQQVDGMGAILDEWARLTGDLRHLAYMLATAFHETARTMQPIREYGGYSYFMRMYDKTGDRPHIASQLGNTVEGDGATFSGRGYVQLTGRRNYKKAGDSIGVNLLANPDLALKPTVAAKIMFDGMRDGWFTGRKLSGYFNSTKTDWMSARKIINGTDQASAIAGYAQKFHDALKRATEKAAGGVSDPAPMPTAPKQEIPPVTTPVASGDDPPREGLFSRLWAAIRRLFHF